MESQIRMLERLSARAGGDPAIDFYTALARSDLAPDHGARTKLRAAIQRFPADRRLPELVEGAVADWIAREINAYPPGLNAVGEPMGGLDPDTDAQTVIHAIESRCKALGVYPGLLPSTAFEMAGIGVHRGEDQREAGRLVDARQTAAWLSAFGKTLARRYPDEAAFHLILSLASEQEAENARKVEDYATIEAALSQALCEGCTALRLDPRNTYTRLRIADLQDKLFGLASRRRKREVGNRSASPREGNRDAARISSQSPTLPDQLNVRQ
jgi:hypothetical protein